MAAVFLTRTIQNAPDLDSRDDQSNRLNSTTKLSIQNWRGLKSRITIDEVAVNNFARKTRFALVGKIAFTAEPSLMELRLAERDLEYARSVQQHRRPLTTELALFSISSTSTRSQVTVSPADFENAKNRFSQLQAALLSRKAALYDVFNLTMPADLLILIGQFADLEKQQIGS